MDKHLVNLIRNFASKPFIYNCTDERLIKDYFTIDQIKQMVFHIVGQFGIEDYEKFESLSQGETKDMQFTKIDRVGPDLTPYEYMHLRQRVLSALKVDTSAGITGNTLSAIVNDLMRKDIYDLMVFFCNHYSPHLVSPCSEPSDGPDGGLYQFKAGMSVPPESLGKSSRGDGVGKFNDTVKGENKPDTRKPSEIVKDIYNKLESDLKNHDLLAKQLHKKAIDKLGQLSKDIGFFTTLVSLQNQCDNSILYCKVTKDINGLTETILVKSIDDVVELMKGGRFD